MAAASGQSGSDDPGSDLVGAIAAIRASVSAANPQLYRHLALYLQVLRQVLPGRVERACFHLATRFHARRYLALDPAERRALQRRIQALVLRCSSLLTVEQLAVLAAQMARESARRRRRVQRRLLERLTGGPDLAPPGPVRSAGGDDAAGVMAELLQRPELNAGAVAFPGSLSFSLRLVDDLESASAAAAAPATSESGAGDDEHAAGASSAANEGSGGEPASAMDHGDPADTVPWAVDGGDPALWQQGLLPADPLELLRWLDGLDLALQRRLRNLSHAINVELLRVGLCPTLLPVSLLDAALVGRVDSAQAPPQLLVLPLPFPAPGLADGARAVAVLLRDADLELEEPKLRTCRHRLQHHRQELRRMADRFRRLQRRLDIHQAERLWFQDLPPAAPGAD